LLDKSATFIALFSQFTVLLVFLHVLSPPRHVRDLPKHSAQQFWR